MKTAVLALVVILSAIALWLWQRIQKNKKLPPGPLRWPVVGNMLQMAWDDSKYPYEFFKKQAAIHGPVLFVLNGSTKTVVFNGYDAVKKILTSDEWMDRSDDRMNLLRTYEKRLGIIFSQMDIWKVTRRFTVRNLRDYGFGRKDTMEAFMRRETSEIQKYMDRLIAEENGHFSPHHFFDIPALNVVWALLTGTRFQHDDPQATKLVEGIAKFNHALKFTGGFLNAFPVVHKFVPDALLGVSHLNECTKHFRKSMETLLEEYRGKGTYKTNPENFVELFLQHIDMVRDGEIADHEGIFTDENLVSVLYDMFWAGSDTSSSTVSYAILWLTLHQDCQRKFREELKQFIASNGRLPGSNDKNLLPYTRATILEVHRRSHIVPYSQRQVYRDTPFDDFIIPAGTIVLPNYHSVLMEEPFWRDPENFRPERFLDSQEEEIVKAKADHVIPFGLGKRNCMGETVAETSIYLLLTFLFSRYEFHPISENHVYDTDPLFGVVMAPQPFTVKIKHAC